MSTLTPAQIAGYARQAGFTGTPLVWAVAVALAESGGNPAATHTNANGSHDRGLWQINDQAHPEVSDAQAFDPAGAAAAAYAISGKGKSFGPWSTYGNGAAGKQLGAAQLAAAAPATVTAQPANWITGLVAPLLPGLGQGLASGAIPNALPSVPGLDALGGLASSLAAIASALVKAGAWTADPHNWVRILEVAGGVVVIGLGVKLLADTGAGPVSDIAGGALKAGHVATTPVRAAGRHAGQLAKTAATAAVVA